MVGERGRLDRRGWRLAKHIPVFSFPAGARRETHRAATETVALPKHQDMPEKSRKIMKINDLRLFDHPAFGPARAERQRSRAAKTRSAVSNTTCAMALHDLTIPHVNGNASTKLYK